MSFEIVCADVGSVKGGKFGWWASSERFGVDPKGLVDHVVALIKSGNAVALGFECPLFVPLPAAAEQLGAARSGEGSRPWSAGAGCGALATGLVQMAWVLREICAGLGKNLCAATTDWQSFLAKPEGLIVWEAFVSTGGKGKPSASNAHVDDARLAAEAFRTAVGAGKVESMVTTGGAACLSLAGVALLRTGWISDVAVLSSPCLVVMVGRPGR